MLQQYPSLLLQRAVDEFAKLPGIGQKTALRLVLHQLRCSKEEVSAFTSAIDTLRQEVCYCKQCHNISDTECCSICSDPRRDASTICVVENVRDVMSIENTGQYTGLYHVLGGVISPVDGIGPQNLEIESLIKRVEEEKPAEIIMALSSTMEGDTTTFFIQRKLEGHGVRLTAIARGISVGDEIEYTDEITLGRAIVNRTELTK